MKKRTKTVIRYALLLVSFALLYLVLSRIGFTNIYNSLRKANALLLFLAFFAALLFYLLWSLKLYMVLKQVIKCTYMEIIPIMFSGAFMSVITPGSGIGGEPLKAYYISKLYKKPKATMLAAVFVDSGINVVVNTVFMVLCLIAVLLFFKISSEAKLLFEITLAIVAVLILAAALFGRRLFNTVSRFIIDKISPGVYSIKLLKSIKKRFKTKKKFKSYLKERFGYFAYTIKSIIKNSSTLKKEFIVGFAMYSFAYFSTYLIFLSFGYRVNPLYPVVAVTTGVLVSQVVFVPGGIGIGEASIISVYILLGVPPEIAASVALIDRAVMYFNSLILGYLGFNHINKKILSAEDD